MNFLAHAVLSPEDDEILAGNVCADLIKGRVEHLAPPGIVAGIALHRAIDRFADRHRAFRACTAYVAAPRRRYAPVIVDVFFDHCLARNWGRYSSVDLDVFVERVCARIEQQADIIPVRDRERRSGAWSGAAGWACTRPAPGSTGYSRESPTGRNSAIGWERRPPISIATIRR